MSCSEPPAGFSRWTLRLLAEKVVELDYIENISHETVRRVLKKTNLDLGNKMACEPLAGKRIVKITENKTRKDWAVFLQDIASLYQEAEKITLVMDNLNTHSPGSFYEVFPPNHAKALWDRFEFVYTPKHGSWLNMAEIELNVLIGQCLNQRIDNMEAVKTESAAWQESRNNKGAK